jgi:hypothetical protein
MKKLLPKIGVVVLIIVSIFLIGYRCGVKSSHPSTESVIAEWNSLTSDTQYDIKEMVFKIRHAEIKK